MSEAQNSSRGPDAESGGQGWLWLVCVVALANQLCVHFCRPVLSYKMLALGCHESVIGLVTSAYAIAPLLIALPLGRVLDRQRAVRWFIFTAMLLVAGGAALLGFSDHLLVVALGFTVIGLGQLGVTMAGQSAIASGLKARQLDAGFGWLTAAFSLGQLFGPLAAGLLLAARSGELLAQTNYLLSGAGLVALVCAPLILLPVRWASKSSEAAGTPAREEKATLGALLRIPNVGSHLFAAMTLLVILDILTAFLPLVAEDFGVGPEWVGLALGARGAASVLSRFLLPVLTRSFSRSMLLKTSLLGSGILIAAATLTLPLGVLCLILFTLGGFLLGLGQPLTLSSISEAVPQNWRATALAMRLLGNRLAQVIIPTAAGLLAGVTGPAGAILLACGMLVGSGVEKLSRARQNVGQAQGEN